MDNQEFDLSGQDTPISDPFGNSQVSIIDDGDADFANILLGGPVTSDEKPAPIKTPKQEKQKEVPKKDVPAAEETDEEEEEIVVDPLAETAEEEQQGEEQEEETEDEQSEEDEDINTFTALANDLITAGVFTEREGELPTTAEEFLQRFNAEASDRANANIYNFLKSKHGEEGVEMFNAVFVKGIPPTEFLQRYATIESLAELDIDVEANQEKVYREYYKRQGFSEDKIEKWLQKTKDAFDLEEQAKEFHSKLIESEQEELAEIAEQKEQQQRVALQQRQQYVQGIATVIQQKEKEKSFDGIPLTPKVAKELGDFLVTQKYQLPSGELLTDFDKYLLELRDPKNYEARVKLALLAMNNLDLSKVKQTAISQASNEVFKNLTRKNKTQKRAEVKPSTDFFDALK